ncbi:MAG: ParB N-terminal domain-containing protein [Clostridia bacterium]|nr:ParB N-terminal domain-containing protein [Clostridia bacterium]
MEIRGKVRSFADIFGEDIESEPKQFISITELELSRLTPFPNHPFKLYQGDRLNDMVCSIKELGIILPIIVRPTGNNIFEILSGHNRVNAAKIAGLEKVPAIIKEELSNEEANLIVTETNLLQRSFSDLSHSERAVALVTHYNTIKHQGKRNDLIKEIEMLSKVHNLKAESSLPQVGTRSDKKVGEKYNLSKNTVARYIRLNELIPKLLNRVDSEEIAFIPAVTLSFVKKSEQQDIERILAENNLKVDMVKADILRSNTGTLTADKIYAILSGELGKKKKNNKLAPIKIKPKVISRFFTQEQKASEIEDIIEKALEQYFSSLPKHLDEKEDIE